MKTIVIVTKKISTKKIWMLENCGYNVIVIIK